MSKETQNELHSLYPPGARIPGEEFFKDIERLRNALTLDLLTYGTAAYRIGNGTIHHLQKVNGVLHDFTRPDPMDPNPAYLFKSLPQKNAENTEKENGNAD